MHGAAPSRGGIHQAGPTKLPGSHHQRGMWGLEERGVCRSENTEGEPIVGMTRK